ncbi:hypothetical protein T03_4937, partial [Trichinella britovi]
LAGGARVLFLPTRDFRVPPLGQVTSTGSELFRPEHYWKLFYNEPGGLYLSAGYGGLR